MTIKIPESLPWSVVDTRIYVTRSDDKGRITNDEIAVATRASAKYRHLSQEHAAYIVHAANNYPALVRALEGIVEHIEKRNLDTFDAMLQKLQIEASAALKKANGG